MVDPPTSLILKIRLHFSILVSSPNLICVILNIDNMTMKNNNKNPTLSKTHVAKYKSKAEETRTSKIFRWDHA